jgi:hyperosmotically inducible protein
MRVKLLSVIIAASSFVTMLAIAQQQHFPENPLPQRPEDPITREVRHDLLSLPNFGAFDNITYQVNGSTIVLNGQVVQPALKSAAENAVKGIEGIQRVENHIQVLPPSSQDDALRIAEFRSIYEYPQLQKYDLGLQKPIRIIVKNARVTLEGVVDNEQDRELAGVRAKQVPGTLGVTNNLQIVPLLR